LIMPEISQQQQDYTAALRQLLDAAAAQAVMGGGGQSDRWIEDVAHSLAQIGAMAELAERPDILSLANQLEKRAAGVRRGQEDNARFEPALNQGLSQIEAALASTPGGPAKPSPASCDEPPNVLAQDPELVRDFVLESAEHLDAIEAQLLHLEQNPEDPEPIHTIFRGFHTIKGLAGFLGFQSIQEVAHEVETLLDMARNGRLAVTSQVVDVVLAGSDYLKTEIRRVECAGNGEPLPPAAANGGLVQRIRAQALSGGAEGEASPEGFGAGLRQLSGAVSNAGAAASSASGAPETRSGQADKRTGEARAVKVDTAKLDYLVDMVGEMVIAESLVRHSPELEARHSPNLLRNLTQLGRITDEVQKTAMSMRMIPIGQLFQKMARLVRDLSRKSGKHVELETSGEDTELDRNIVEELADPLMHMIRNALDHGIETPDERRAAGKPEIARLRLHAYHQAGHISLEVSDDGRGLNKEKILAKARDRKLVDDASRLSETEIFNLIFEPGFSTAEKITDISGRGVGMDVVRKKVQQLRGRVEIQSAAGQGTTFLLKLPLTLAIIDGLVVGVGSERYIVPLFAIREMLRPAAGMVSTIENRDEMALVRGRLFPVVRLHRRFSVKPQSEDPAQGVLIIAESAGRDFCLLVDQVIGKQEVVIKSLGESLKNVPGIAGGAILGDGRVGLILDMEGVFRRVAGA
ncbi:MAG TPA: chemotaxis protein CheA, partial [Bryobacteraceae bacterium]|nr:chemotaxis protein CheA [Bryobacteraceae bacterium]